MYDKFVGTISIILYNMLLTVLRLIHLSDVSPLILPDQASCEGLRMVFGGAKWGHEKKKTKH